MTRAGRRRLAAAITLSAGFHAVLLIVLAMQAPMLPARPEESAGPPEPIIPVLLLPRLPPTPNAPPAPLRLHRRPQPYAPPPPIAPLPVPPIAVPRPAPPGPVTVHPAPLPEGPKSDLRATLRGSPIGCANPELLSPQERDRCNETLGKGAKTAPVLNLGLSAEKQGDFDRQAQHREECRQYREAPGMGTPPPLRNGPC